MSHSLTIVILAAGLGTRMKSKRAKVLHEAAGKALIEHVVDSALRLTSPDHIVVVVGHQAESVKAKLASRQVRFGMQTEQRGTGHALAMCRETVPSTEGRLLLLYGDTPLVSLNTLQKLLSEHEDFGDAAAVLTAELEDATGYGRIVRNSAGGVEAIVEQKVATPEQLLIREINSGMYCFNASLLWKHLSEIQENPVSKEFYLTDIVEVLNRAGHRVRPVLMDDRTELLGINTRVELAFVDRTFRQRKTEELMLAGATIQLPETVVVDADVKVGMDTVISPYAQVLGSSVIGENCFIGSGAIIRDSSLGDGVHIDPYTLINASVVENEASIGPFARLRLDNVVGANSHIGNFVELKKARLGPGVKAGHLAYLGDAEIAAGVNIGAGTITCNYDGVDKHKTTIGEGAFVGSNSTLVAPLTVGEGTYIAAGSTITSDVPKDALALGRGRQVNKEEWARRRRESRTKKR